MSKEVETDLSWGSDALDAMIEEMEEFAKKNGYEWLSADEMLHALPDDAPEAHRSFLSDFIDRWNEAQDAYDRWNEAQS